MNCWAGADFLAREHGVSPESLWSVDHSIPLPRLDHPAPTPRRSDSPHPGVPWPIAHPTTDWTRCSDASPVCRVSACACLFGWQADRCRHRQVQAARAIFQAADFRASEASGNLRRKNRKPAVNRRFHSAVQQNGVDEKAVGKEHPAHWRSQLGRHQHFGFSFGDLQEP